MFPSKLYFDKQSVISSIDKLSSLFCGATTLTIMKLSITTLSITTLGITTLSITTFSITTLSIATFIITTFVIMINQILHSA